MQSPDAMLDGLLLFRPEADSLLRRLRRTETENAAAAELVQLAASRGWQGNLWQCLLAWTLASDENAFSLSCERRKAKHDSLWALAEQDMEIYRDLFRCPPDILKRPCLRDFIHDSAQAAAPAAQRIATLGKELANAKTPQDMLTVLAGHFQAHGLGTLGLGQIFRVREEGAVPRLYPVENRRTVHLDDLVGYESQKALLLENTLAFLRGQHANNVLLYGDAGTGKSTSIQAIAGEYAPRGLRLIELYKSQFALIPSILDQIKGRNYRFILFLDDLSFEENEVEYKHLKAVMEGGAEAAPENVLIYATSNRRHLVKETWNDRNDMEHDGDIHRSDTMEEKLSLAGRFGLQIYYPNPTFEQYQDIVRELARRADAADALTPEQLRAAASSWQVRRGNRSGRTAQQFVNDLLCHQADEPQNEEDNSPC